MRRGLECSIGWRKIEITSESIYYDFYFNQLLVIFILSKNNITNATISYDQSIIGEFYKIFCEVDRHIYWSTLWRDYRFLWYDAPLYIYCI